MRDVALAGGSACAHERAERACWCGRAPHALHSPTRLSYSPAHMHAHSLCAKVAYVCGKLPALLSPPLAAAASAHPAAPATAAASASAAPAGPQPGGPQRPPDHPHGGSRGEPGGSTGRGQPQPPSARPGSHPSTARIEPAGPSSAGGGTPHSPGAAAHPSSTAGTEGERPSAGTAAGLAGLVPCLGAEAWGEPGGVGDTEMGEGSSDLETCAPLLLLPKELLHEVLASDALAVDCVSNTGT